MTGDHEVLTPSGWIRLDQAGDAQIIAQWHADTQEITFGRAPINSFAWTGNLVHINGARLDWRVTPNHRIGGWYASGKKGRTRMYWKVWDAQNLPRVRVPVAGYFNRGSILDNWARLAVALQADATIEPGRVAWALTKPRKCQRMVWLLNELGLKYSTYHRREQTVYRVRIGDLTPALEYFSDLKTKTFSFPKLLYAGDIHELVNELTLWDGTSIQHRGYFSTNLINIDIACTLGHLAGSGSSRLECPRSDWGHKPLEHVVFSEVDHVTMANIRQIEAEPYKGLVYCPTTATGFFMVRRGKQIAVTGNSQNPSTLRFASSCPNMQNLPRASKESPWAGWVKDCFVAPKGHCFWACDFAAIEAVLVGYFAGSARYTRAAKLGVHAFLASHIINQPASFDWEESRLREHFKHIKTHFKPEYETAKRTVHGCLTGDHEVLTPNGWVRFDTLLDNTPIAQWHENGSLTFAIPSRVVRHRYQGEMVECLGRGLSAVMTPEHRVPVTGTPGGSIHAERADTLIRGCVPVTGQMSGGMDADLDWLRLAVAVQADANLPGGAVFHLVKHRKRERLLALLTRLGITPNVVKCKCHPDGVRISISKFDLDPVREWLGSGKAKLFNLQALIAAAPAVRAAFLDEVPYWDGSHSEGLEGRQTAYFTTSRHNAEVVQTVAHITGRQALLRAVTGRAANQKPGFIVSFNKRQWAHIGWLDRHERVTFDGTVYCVTVPTGWFIIRHRDRISITGNSNYCATPRHIHDIFPETFPTIKSAAMLQGMYFELFPEIPTWHKELCLRVDASRKRKTDGLETVDPWTIGVAYAQNPFGYVHRFYNVLDWIKVESDWVWSLGEDAKRLVAFLPQSTAAAIIKQKGRILWEDYPWVGETMRLWVHDEVFGESRDEQVDEHIRIATDVMTGPIPELPLDPSWGLGDCLSIGVESKKGTVWSEMR